MHETIIGADARVEGNLSGQLLRIYGHVAGTVEAEEVIVEQGGQIGGSLSAKGVRVLGRVDGLIQAEQVLIESSGVSLGGISAPSVSLAEGCTIQGRLDSNLPGPAATPIASAPAQAVAAITAYARDAQPSQLPPTLTSKPSQPAAPLIGSVPTPAPAQAVASLAVTARQVSTAPPAPKTAPKTAPRAFSLDGVRLTAKD